MQYAIRSQGKSLFPFLLTFHAEVVGRCVADDSIWIFPNIDALVANIRIAVVRKFVFVVIFTGQK